MMRAYFLLYSNGNYKERSISQRVISTVMTASAVNPSFLAEMFSFLSGFSHILFIQYRLFNRSSS